VNAKRRRESIGIGLLRIAAFALVLFFAHDHGSADGTLPRIKAKQRKKLQLQKALAADSPQFASALLAVHHDSPVNSGPALG
jgi:hypothetical protein